MAYPSIYNVTYSYSGFQQSQGDNSFPGTQLDSDLAGLDTSLKSLSSFVQTVMRADGALQNGSVTYDSLAPALQTAGLAPAVAWTTATKFLLGNSVTINSNLYRCLIPHTSGVFATDLAAGDWLFVAALLTGPTGAAGANGAAGTNGTNGPPSAPQGRLTLTSGTPVMTASVAGATTVYYTSCSGKTVPIYNGTAVATYPIGPAGTVGACEQALALGSNWVTNTNYDFFEVLNAGVPTLVTGPAWSSGTARGTGAGTPELIQFDGLLTNKNSMTARVNNTTTITVPANQGTYLGTMRTGLAGQTSYVLGGAASGGQAAIFGLWNAYNRAQTGVTVTDNGASYAYTSNTIRQARASAGNQASFIVGLTGDAMSVSYSSIVQVAAVAGALARVSLGYNTTSTYVTSIANSFLYNPVASANYFSQLVAGQLTPTLGWNFVAPVEEGDNTNATNFNVNSNASLNIIWPN